MRAILAATDKYTRDASICQLCKTGEAKYHMAADGGAWVRMCVDCYTKRGGVMS